jgi:Glycosyltransferase family 10 (fucosyltransferase) C-term
LSGPLRNIERFVRLLRHKVAPSQVNQERALSPAVLKANSIVLRFGSKTVRWVFQYTFPREFAAQFILPWAMPDARRLASDSPADFSVGVYLYDQTISGSFADLPGTKFLLAGELETRHPHIDRTLSFVQGPQPHDDPDYIRYAPIMCFWSGPLEPAKTRKCSVVDSGRYAWRAELIQQLCRRIGEVDIFGGLSGRKLGGYHETSGSPVGNDKYLGIQDFCFYLSLEREVADDYLTEKFADAVLCNAVPIYRGATNARLYAYPEAYIPMDDVGKIDWNNWRPEYERRLSALRAQKEFFRTRLNVFSYFHSVTDNPSLLDQPRPITLAGQTPTT